MSILSFIGDLIKPATDLIDKLVTTDEDREKLKLELAKAEHLFVSKVLEYEGQLVEAQASIVKAEAAGESWLQRNWRPVLMISIVAVIVNNYLIAPYVNAVFGPGTAPFLELPEQLWTLMTLGVSGYIGGRTVEKIAPGVLDFFKGKNGK